jgi:uncharacterized protein (TIGR02246 family)
MKIRNLLMLFLAGSFLTACAAEDDAATEEAVAEAPAVSEDQAAVEAIAANYQEHFNMGHADVVADLYHDDAVGLFADGSVNLGRAEIEAALDGSMPAFSNLAINREATHMGEGLGLTRGTWTAYIAGADGEPMPNSGRYMTMFRQGEDGAWKIQVVLVNYDSEQPPEAWAGAASPNVDDEEDEGAAALVAAYEAAWNAGDAAGVAAQWAEDAHVALTMAPTIEGRDAVEAFMAERIGGTLDIHSKNTIPMGDGWSVNGGWWEVKDVEAPYGGTYLGLVWTGEDGASVFQWGISNSMQLPTE